METSYKKKLYKTFIVISRLLQVKVHEHFTFVPILVRRYSHITVNES